MYELMPVWILGGWWLCGWVGMAIINYVEGAQLGPSATVSDMVTAFLLSLLGPVTLGMGVDEWQKLTAYSRKAKRKNRRAARRERYKKLYSWYNSDLKEYSFKKVGLDSGTCE